MTTKVTDVVDYVTILWKHLILSISSVQFYQNVYSKYKGYGIKYISVICIISSVIYCIFIFDIIISLRDAFEHGKSKNIEYILSQIPTVHYNGATIELEYADDMPDPFFIYDAENKKFAAIDYRGTLTPEEKDKIPLIFRKNVVNVNIFEFDGISKKRDSIPINYATILGDSAWTINADSFRSYAVNLLNSASRVFIYVIMPMICLMRCVGVVLSRMFVILIIYVISHFTGMRMNMQTSCRLVMFASGLEVLLQPIMVSIVPQLTLLVPILQIIPGVLMVTALARLKRGKQKL